jgi:hypothetical protein
LYVILFVFQNTAFREPLCKKINLHPQTGTKATTASVVPPSLRTKSTPLLYAVTQRLRRIHHPEAQGRQESAAAKGLAPVTFSLKTAEQLFPRHCRVS